LKWHNGPESGAFRIRSSVAVAAFSQRSDSLWSAVNSIWWGHDIQCSFNDGETWRKSSAGLEFAPERKLNLARVWKVVPDRESRPEVLWCGVDPGCLFRSDDGGKNWYEVAGLNQHPSRDKWMPGGGGLMVHAIVPDPWNEKRVYVGMSVAGCFRSDDDGASWHPFNKNVRADFQPKPFPEVGQCVHSMRMSPTKPGWLFQQNHCGVYRSKDSAENWIDISKGLPSRFGFPMAIHPHDPETIYVVPEIGPEKRFVCDERLGIFRSRNGGKNWQRMTKGLPQKNVFTQVLRHAASADSCDPAGIYVGTIGGEIFYSRNEGDSWHVLAAQLPPILSVEASVA